MPQVPSGEVLPVTTLLTNKCDENVLYQELTLAGMGEAQVNCLRQKHTVKRRHVNCKLQLKVKRVVHHATVFIFGIYTHYLRTLR